MDNQKLHIFTTGGTIDKVYFDALSEFQVGATALDSILKEANVTIDYQVTSLMRKDSLDIDDQDRALIHHAVSSYENDCILITHGTDTMVETAMHVQSVTNKTIVFTGAMQPASQRSTDAIFNIGFAIAATQILKHGVYIAMNGRIFNPLTTVKNRENQEFIDKVFNP